MNKQTTVMMSSTLVLKQVFASLMVLSLFSASSSVVAMTNDDGIISHHVIGAGLGRTGTLSLKTALERLGMGPIFHMTENLELVDKVGIYWKELYEISPVPHIETGVPLWPPRLEERSVFVEEKSKRLELLRNIMGTNNGRVRNESVSETSLSQSNKQHDEEGHYFHGSVDFPMCLHFMDLLEVHNKYGNSTSNTLPKRKVILTSRDNGASWATSVLTTIMNFQPKRAKFGVRIMLHTLMNPIRVMMYHCFFRFLPHHKITDELDFDRLANMHDTWNNHVRTSMKQYASINNIDLNDIFLDYHVKQGWEPLCKFLEISNDACPLDEEFPRVNDSLSFLSFYNGINMTGYGILAVALLGTIGVLVAITRWNTCSNGSVNDNRVKFKNV